MNLMQQIVQEPQQEEPLYHLLLDHSVVPVQLFYQQPVFQQVTDLPTNGNILPMALLRL